MADQSQKFSTIIGPDARVKGDLEFDSAAKVLGRFEGAITSKGLMYVADGAECKATISAKEITVEGKIEGNVEAGDLLELKPSGCITGDIVASRMTMAEGASISGYLTIGSNGKAPQAKSPTALESKPNDAKAATPAKAAAKAK